MDPRRIASVAAVVGGVAWLVKVVLVWLGDGDSGSAPVAIAEYVGWVGLFVALAAAGYTLVEKAPVWLRAVVAVATPLLVLMVWLLVDQAARAMLSGDGWLREELSTLIAAVVALVLGLWGFRRRRPAGPAGDPPPVRGRRAAR